MQRQAQQQWPNNSMRQKQGVQGLNNGKSQSMQDQLAASLTYAQKVKGRRPRNAQQPQALPQAAPSTSVNRQFRMVPAQQILAAQAMPAALQHYAYPYNYSNLQRQRSAQQASQQAQPVPSSNPPTRASSSSASASSSTQPSSSAVGHSSNPYRSRGRGPQRDFFDRRVQHNVNNAVSQYYNYPQSQSQQPSQVNQYQSQRLAQQQQQRQMYRQNRVNQYRFNQQQQQQQRQSMMNNGNNNNNMMMRGRRDQRRNNPNNNMSYRGGRGGGSFGQRPSYRDNQRNNMNRMPPPQSQQPSSSSSGGVNRKRGKPSDLQLDRYQNAADRDVLCWIFENQGKCRYGERCQWLHLDRETGQYIPTVYIMNSLSDKEMVCKPVNDKKEQDEKEDEKASEEEATPKGKKEDEQDDDDDVDPVLLQKKFMLLMQEGIKKKAEEEEKRKVMEAEENKMQKDDKQKKKKKKGKEEQDEDNKEEEEDETICKEVSKYGAYGTTFDRQNVCWEFNTFVGCRKGSKCKWAHQYLVKESAHPYTGEKLNGMAVRKFRVSNNI